MQIVTRLLTYGILLLICINCSSDNQKIYKQFDTVEISNNQFGEEDVSAWNGGPGFEVYAQQLGWETNNDIISNGSPNAIKGDTITLIGDNVMPPTFRAIGKETRSQFLSILESATYEPLLNYNPETSKYEQTLATHWKTGKDSLTFFYRIDPRARWADGNEVTSEDGVATFKLLTDEGHGDPNTYTTYLDLFYNLVGRYFKNYHLIDQDPY